MSEDDSILYLYGVIREGQSLPAPAGVALAAVPHAAIAGLVEPVPAAEFSPDVLEEKLQSLDWVARLAEKHQVVLASAMRHGAVVPARLCTLFSGAPALAQSLAAHEERFLAALARIADREEWGVKAFCAEAALQERVGQADPRAEALRAALATATPGQAYVLAKQRDARLAELAAARLDEVTAEAIAVLEGATVDLRLLAGIGAGLGSAAPAGEGETLLLSLAAFVDATARAAFHGAVAELEERFAEEGFTFAVSGPWPPYSFCDEADEELDPAAAGEEEA
jgi:gas vesicle protein GvpL/GvpF